MIKQCKICGNKYFSKENEYNTNPYFDKICQCCGDNIIQTTDNTNYEPNVK